MNGLLKGPFPYLWNKPQRGKANIVSPTYLGSGRLCSELKISCFLPLPCKSQTAVPGWEVQWLRFFKTLGIFNHWVVMQTNVEQNWFDLHLIAAVDQATQVWHQFQYVKLMSTQGVWKKQEFQLIENSSPYRQKKKRQQKRGDVLRNMGSKVFHFGMPKILGYLGKGIRFINYMELRTQNWIHRTFY